MLHLCVKFVYLYVLLDGEGIAIETSRMSSLSYVVTVVCAKTLLLKIPTFFCSETLCKSQEVIGHFWHNTCTRTQVFVALVCGTYAAAVTRVC